LLGRFILPFGRFHRENTEENPTREENKNHSQSFQFSVLTSIFEDEAMPVHLECLKLTGKKLSPALQFIQNKYKP